MSISFSQHQKESNYSKKRPVSLTTTLTLLMLGMFSSIGFLRDPREIRITPKIKDQIELNKNEYSLNNFEDILKELNLKETSKSSHLSLTSLKENVSVRSFSQSAVAVGSSNLGKINVDWLTLKKDVKDAEQFDKKVMIGGHSVGILVSEYGICVVGHYAVTDSDQVNHFPSRDAGIEVGDIILSVNERKITSVDGLKRAIKDFYVPDVPLNLEVKRNEDIFTAELRPIVTYDTEEGQEDVIAQIKIGLYVKENTAGVGTLTFWDPEDGKFGALGHVVTDVDTGKPVSISHGSLIFAQIAGVQAGTNGNPGEKIGSFRSDAESIGIIEDNSDIGIYGVLTEKLENPIYHYPIPIATASLIKEGPAEILTVVNGSKIENFQCEIINVSKQSKKESKSFVIEITDPKLLDITGGIIQGMSGSPVIQNGRIVGAVTHVLVNDPTRGYGIFIENMLEAAK